MTRHSLPQAALCNTGAAAVARLARSGKNNRTWTPKLDRKIYTHHTFTIIILSVLLVVDVAARELGDVVEAQPHDLEVARELHRGGAP